MLSLWSHVIASSFAEWSTWSPSGNFVSGHSLTICDIVCLLPQAHSGLSLMPHTCSEAAQIPWPVRYGLSRVQSRHFAWDRTLVGKRLDQLLRTGWLFLVSPNLPSKPHVQTRQSWALRTISDVWTIIEVRDDQKYHRTLVGWGEVEFSPRFWLMHSLNAMLCWEI